MTHPTDSMVADILARARGAVGEGAFEEAAAIARAGLAEAPESLELRLFLADTLGRYGHPVEAVAVLAEAVVAAPGNADLLNHLGVAQRRAGRFPAALASFREAARLDPANPWAFHNIAMALMHDPGAQAAAMVAALVEDAAPPAHTEN